MEVYCMAKEFAKAFYRSSKWKKCRRDYITRCAGLCEMCLQDGIIKHGDELHHKIHLTPDNITNPDITLNEKNLIFLCREHHQKIHENDRYKKPIKRYKINKKTGEVETT